MIFFWITVFLVVLSISFKNRTSVSRSQIDAISEKWVKWDSWHSGCCTVNILPLSVRWAGCRGLWQLSERVFCSYGAEMLVVHWFPIGLHLLCCLWPAAPSSFSSSSSALNQLTDAADQLPQHAAGGGKLLESCVCVGVCVHIRYLQWGCTCSSVWIISIFLNNLQKSKVLIRKIPDTPHRRPLWQVCCVTDLKLF